MKLTGRLSRRAAVRFAGLGAVGAAVAGVAGRTVEQAGAAPGNEIVGSWEVAADDPIGFALQTFTVDGGFISTHGLHPSRTPGHGAWVRTGDGRFLVELVNYGFLEGTAISRRVTRLEVTVDASGNSYTSRFSYEDIDLAGKLLGSAQGTARATRITPHPFA
jgi:hypothetical protein